MTASDTDPYSWHQCHCHCQYIQSPLELSVPLSVHWVASAINHSPIAGRQWSIFSIQSSVFCRYHFSVSSLFCCHCSVVCSILLNLSMCHCVALSFTRSVSLAHSHLPLVVFLDTTAPVSCCRHPSSVLVCKQVSESNAVAAIRMENVVFYGEIVITCANVAVSTEIFHLKFPDVRPMIYV